MERLSYMPISWPDEAHGAVSLTFDGATQATAAIRAKLDSLDVRATFYADPAELLQAVAEWKGAILGGHEIGNHGLRSACDEGGLLAHLSRDAIEEELTACRELLSETFDQPRHSATMPLVKTIDDETGMPAVPEMIRRSIVRLNEEAMGDIVRRTYDVVRGPLGRFNRPPIDLKQLKCCRVDGLDAVSIGLIVQVAISQGDWAILSWGVTPDSLAVLQVAKWLRRQPVWIAPVVRVADHVRESSASSATFHSL